MSEDTATIEPGLKEIGDKIADLTLKQAKELSDYIKDEYGIEPAAGGGVVMAAPAADGGDDAGDAKTDFDIVLTGVGDKKTAVIKVVKSIVGGTLMEAKKLVDSAPSTIREGVSKDEADKIKGEIEEAGGSVELK